MGRTLPLAAMEGLPDPARGGGLRRGPGRSRAQRPAGVPELRRVLHARAQARRPAAAVGAGAIACPADGRISQAGAIVDGRIFQAKGHQFSAAELLGDAAAAAAYAAGRFLTVYLSPRDYHRVHMPLDGELLSTVHIPGRLFSVAPFAVAAVPRLFARNERLVCHFRGAHGPFAVVMVGAMLVSGIETVWGGVEVPPYASRTRARDWSGRGLHLARGDELGRFNMGSTVIVLLPADAPMLAPLAPEQPVRVGQNLANVTEVAKPGQDS